MKAIQGMVFPSNLAKLYAFCIELYSSTLNYQSNKVFVPTQNAGRCDSDDL